MPGADLRMAREIIVQELAEHSDPGMAIAAAYQKIGGRIIDDIAGGKIAPGHMRALARIMRGRMLFGFLVADTKGDQGFGGKLAEYVITVLSIWQETNLYLFEHYDELPGKDSEDAISMAGLSKDYDEVNLEVNGYVADHVRKGYVIVKAVRLEAARDFFARAILMLMGDGPMAEFSERFNEACDLMRDFQARSVASSDSTGN